MSAHCKRSVSWSRWVATALLLGAGGVGQCGSFFTPDGKCFQRLTQNAGFESVPYVCRNEAGTKLFLMGRTADGNTLVEIVSREGVRFRKLNCGRPVLGDDDQLVCCVTNHRALRFANGDEVQYRFTNEPTVRFEYSPGGAYLFFDRTNNPETMPSGWESAPQLVPFLTSGATNMGAYIPHWVGVVRCADPANALFRLPNDFHASNIFARTNEVFIFGLKWVFGGEGRRGPTESENLEAWGLVFSPNGTGYKLSGQLDLSRFDGVLDLDPATGTLLVRTKGDMFAKWGLFVPGTGKYTSLGLAGAYGFFLDPMFCKYLEGVAKKGLDVMKREPSGAANRGQPVGPQTSRTPAAAGPGR